MSTAKALYTRMKDGTNSAGCAWVAGFDGLAVRRFGWAAVCPGVSGCAQVASQKLPFLLQVSYHAGDVLTVHINTTVKPSAPEEEARDADDPLLRMTARAPLQSVFAFALEKRRQFPGWMTRR